MSGFLDKVSGIFFREEEDLPEEDFIPKNDERTPWPCQMSAAFGMKGR